MSKWKSTKSKTFLMYLILFIILIAAVLVSVTMGKFSVSVKELIPILFRKILHMEQTWSNNTDIALFNIRIPRIVAAAVVGASLSVSGAVYQGVFRNPMVSPDILGASGGAGFGACAAIMLGLGSLGTEFSAFFIGVAAVAICYGVAKIVCKGNDMVFTLILTGMVVSAMFNSFISFIKYIADPDDKLPAITFWLMGGLNSVVAERLKYLLIPAIVSFIPVFFLRYQMNILSFSETEARSLGTNVKAVRFILILCCSIMTAATVATVGTIGWVGLVIPHVARAICGSNYQRVIPVSAIVGAVFLLIIDDIARCAFAVEMPLGILTGIIGGPFFLYLLYKGRKKRS